VAPGHVEGDLNFSRSGIIVQYPLLFCPATKGRRFNTGGIGLAGLCSHVMDETEGLAPVGGQYVRPHFR
jgi:hypothetical protein